MTTSASCSVAVSHDLCRLAFAGQKIEVVSLGQGFDVQSSNFAAILLLPLAMASRQDLVIPGVGDPVLAQNLSRLSRVWQAWMPELFAEVAVSFETSHSLPQANSKRDLVLFSGGVDSTYNLLNRVSRGESQDLLTVHGLDYRYHDDSKFLGLLEKTRGFSSRICENHYRIKTDAYDAYGALGIDSGLAHIYVLAGLLFMYETQYRSGEIAADYSRIEEYLFWPWGTSSVTNDYFSGSGFALRTADQDIDRVQKMELLASSPEALAALSVCKDYSFRPNNCGVCAKCLRTKLQFEAATGSVPAIFSDSRRITEAQIRYLRDKGRHEQVFLLQAFHHAQARGTSITGLSEAAGKLKRKKETPRKSGVFFWKK
ncbi:hypothetical protein [Pseudomonas sp.]|uniref:hypothetical protein n=1 Tax=Pseudomonas sp. TaxID=306 RepID=UPI0028A671F8|nr:hypothetical protein [Pseudomonas sp.]